MMAMTAIMLTSGDEDVVVLVEMAARRGRRMLGICGWMKVGTGSRMGRGAMVRVDFPSKG